MKPIEARIKASIFETKNESFLASVYGQVVIPQLASEDHKHHVTYYRIRLLFQNELTEKLKLNYNVGRDWDADHRQQNWIYTISPEFEITDKWQVFVEEYALFKKGSAPTHYIDAGIAYFLSDHVEPDLNAGKGLSGDAAGYFITTGFSFKL